MFGQNSFLYQQSDEFDEVPFRLFHDGRPTRINQNRGGLR